MSPSPIVVCSLAGSAEYDAFFTMSDQAFASKPSADSARYWQEFILSMPTFRPELVRGAFRGATLLGGYTLFERQMHVGAAELLTGCVGSVVTNPDQRKQGVASALMHDCIAYAHSHNYALLLLDGIPDFYYRFGYTDVFDVAIQEINRAAILAEPASTHATRPATVDDAAAVVALYAQTYGGDMARWYNGSFVRSQERQQHVLQRRDAANPLVLAEADGHVTGYLSLAGDEAPADAGEVMAADWPTLLALLQHHARRSEGPSAPQALRYRLPPDSALLYWLIEHLETPGKPTGWAGADAQPSEMWSVRAQSFHHRSAGWMARVVDVAALAQSLFSAWQARWNAALASWHGDITFIVEDTHFVLHFAGEQLQLRPDAAPTGASVRVTPQALAQLVFGYRPISWFASQPDQEIDPSTHAILDILFPTGHTWIPRSDWF